MFLNVLWTPYPERIHWHRVKGMPVLFSVIFLIKTKRKLAEEKKSYSLLTPWIHQTSGWFKGALLTRAPSRSNFFSFHAVFDKHFALPNYRLAHPVWVILDPQLNDMNICYLVLWLFCWIFRLWRICLVGQCNPSASTSRIGNTGSVPLSVTAAGGATRTLKENNMLFVCEFFIA